MKVFSSASHDGFFISVESGSVCRKEWCLGLVGGGIDGFQSFEEGTSEPKISIKLCLVLY